MEIPPDARPDSLVAGKPLTADWLLDTLPWAVLVVDEQHRVQQANQQAARWLGTVPDALPGRFLADTGLPPAAVAALLRPEAGEALPCEVWLPQPERWVALAATRQPGGWVVYGQDITPQKQREQQYQALADNTPDALTRWTPDLRLRYANAAFAQKAGTPLPELLGCTNREMGQPEAVAGPYTAALQRVFDTGQPQEHVNQFSTPQGEVHYHSRLVPELRDGQVDTVLGIARDVTTLRQAEQAARHSHALLHSVFEAVPHSIMVLEAVRDEQQRVVDFRYQLSNGVADRHLGLALQGRLLRHLLPGYLSEENFRLLVETVETGQPAERTQHYDSVGGPLWLHSRYRKLGERVVVSHEDVTASRRAEQEALRLRDELAQRATDKYHALFYGMDQGFCVLEVLFDETGAQAVDYRYLELNPVFAEQSGMPADAQGKTIRELMPDVEPFWFDTFGQVAGTGMAVRLERYLPQLSRWFDVHAFRLGAPEMHQVAVLFTDITTRKHTEEQLRHAAAAEAFQLQLADALRPLADATAVEQQATRLLGEALGANRVFFASVEDDGTTGVILSDYVAGLPSGVGRYPLAAFDPGLLPEWQAGRTTQTTDVTADPRFNDAQRAAYAAGSARAAVGVPLVKGGQLVALLGASHAKPRPWTAEELALLEETAERTWAAVERARTQEALARSEAKYRTLFETMDQGYCLMELVLERGQVTDIIYRDTNAAFEQHVGFGNAVGKPASELFPRIELQWVESLTRVQQTGVAERVEGYNADTAHWFTLQHSRVGGPGSLFIAAVFTDITERKRREANLALLAEVSQDLAQLTNPDETMRGVCEKVGRYFGAAVCAFSPVDEAAGTVAVQYVWHRPDAISPAGVYQLDEYHSAAVQQAMRAGQPEIVRDVASGPPEVAAMLAELHIGAFVNLPLVLDGVWLFILSITASAPRDWRADELDLMRELTARIWTRLARARTEEALRESELRQQLAIEAAELGTYVWHVREDRTEADARLLELFGRSQETHATFAYMLDQGLHPDDRDAYRDVISRAMDPAGDGRLQLDFRVVHPDQSVHWMASTGQVIFEGQPRQAVRIIGTVADITARKQAEEHQAFLLRFSDALRAETSAPSVANRALGLLGEQLQLDRCYVGVYDLAGNRAIFPHQVGNHRIPPLPAEVRLSDFPDALRVAYDRTLRIDDLTQTEGLSDTDRQNLGTLGLRALVAATLRRVGTGPQWAIVALSADVRHWTPGEVALLEEATERTWAAMEHARAEAAVQASEAKLAAIFEALPVGVTVVHPDGTVALANQWVQSFLPTGIMPSRDETQYPRWLAHHPDGHRLERHEFPGARALRGEKVVPGIDMRYTRDDGTGVWTQVSAVPLTDGAGHLSGQVTVLTDIDALKRAEEALRVSETKYRTLFETMDQGFGVAELLPGAGPGGSVDFRWLEINPQVERLTGMPQAALLSGETMRTVMPQLEDVLYEQYEQVALTGEPARFEQYAQVLGRWFDVYVYALDGPASSRIGLLFTNITARKQAEEALRLAEESHRTELEQRVARRTRQLQESRDLLHAIAEAQSAYVTAFKAIRDESGRIVDLEFISANSATERAAGGHSPVGRRYLDLFPEAENSGLLDAFRRVIETGVGEDQEAFYDDGQLTGWFRNNATRLGDGVLSIGEDITARKQAEQERIKNLHLLEQAEAVASLGSWDYSLLSGEFLWSDGMYQLFGLPPGQPVRPDIYLHYVVAEDRPQAERLVAGITAGTGSFEETLRLQVGEQVKTVRVKVVVLYDEAGRPVRVLGVDLDISELQRLEADNLRLRLSQQQALFEAVQAAQEEERRRMAESLHNGIGQVLYATKLRLDLLRSLSEGAAVAEAHHTVDHLLVEAIRQTRALSHELVPLALEKRGLVLAWQEIGRDLSSPQLHLHCQVMLDEEAAPLAPALQLALYRMAQELAQNIVKHAHGATEASLELETTPGWVLLRAEDNGPGFVPLPPSEAGLGLRSIRDRVALLGGVMETGTRAEAGAYVRIRIPLPTL